jgi:hypothetical protein
VTWATKKEKKLTGKPRKKAVLYAVLLLKRIAEQPLKDKEQRAAWGDLWDDIPKDIQEEARAQVKKDYAALGADLPTRTGRRQQLTDEGKIDANWIVVKVSIAGSGHGMWRTHVSKGEHGEELDWSDDEGGKDGATHYKREGKYQGETELMFAGAGGKGTKGFNPKGIKDSGSNSIKALVEQVPILVKNEIESQKDWKTRDVLILMKAHSRGAAAASQVSKKLREMYPKATLETVLIDPVPGPGHTGEDVEIHLEGDEDDDIEPVLNELTVVYSIAPGYTTGFTPQQVMGAQRIIISSQKHSVGLDQGFLYQGKRYKGTAMNSLEPGVYVDLNKSSGSNKELIKFDKNEVKEKMKEAQKNTKETGGDKARHDVIRNVLADYFNRAEG